MITLGFNQKAGVRARRAHSRSDLFLRMCEYLALFLQENNGQDFEVFFGRDRGSINLYVMSKSEAYDFELSRKLADFAAPFIERGVLDSASLLPASSTEELEAFFDPNTALRVVFQHA